MNAYQEPKYEIEVTQDGEGVVKDAKIVNRQSGQPIPDDEPIIIFRARDVYAADVIEDYARKLPSGTHKMAVQVRAQQFRNWANEHKDRMKEPDTTIDEGWTVNGAPGGLPT